MINIVEADLVTAVVTALTLGGNVGIGLGVGAGGGRSGAATDGTLRGGVSDWQPGQLPPPRLLQQPPGSVPQPGHQCWRGHGAGHLQQCEYSTLHL